MGDVTPEAFNRAKPYRWAFVIISTLLATIFVFQWWEWWALLTLIIAPGVYLVIEELVISPPWLADGRVKMFASVGGALIIFFLTDAHVNSTEYYKMVGGVVPVLLLAIIFERRQEYWATNSFAERFLTVVNVFGLVLAGSVVLAVLADDKASNGDARLAISPIAFTLISLLLALVARPHSQVAQQSEA